MTNKMTKKSSLGVDGVPKWNKKAYRDNRGRPIQHGVIALRDAIRRGALDGRSKPARLINHVEKRIINDMGREPTTAELALIRSIAQKMILENFAFDRIFAGDREPSTYVMAVSNSKRLDILALNNLLKEHGQGQPMDYHTCVEQLKRAKAEDEDA
jgi:hypothetical protein